MYLPVFLALVDGPGFGLGDVDDTVDDDVGYVDALGAKLASERLAQGSHGEFARRKGAEVGGASD